MSERFIYLAGPIAGCNKGEANDWREYVSEKLTEISPNIKGVSPLRCEPIVGDVYALGYDDDKFGTPRAIASKNTFDTLMADVVLAYLPTPDLSDGGRESCGTILEIGWAHREDKPVILVTDDPHYLKHPVMDRCADWKLTNFYDALEVIQGILGIYA